MVISVQCLRLNIGIMKKEVVFNITGLRKLVRHYKLSTRDALKLRRLFNSKIISIAYTASGGFDSSNGEFYAKERDINYQLRIKYKIPKINKEKILLLRKVKEAAGLRKTMEIS